MSYFAAHPKLLDSSGFVFRKYRKTKGQSRNIYWAHATVASCPGACRAESLLYTRPSLWKNGSSECLKQQKSSLETLGAAGASSNHPSSHHSSTDALTFFKAIYSVISRIIADIIACTELVVLPNFRFWECWCMWCVDEIDKSVFRLV